MSGTKQLTNQISVPPPAVTGIPLTCSLAPSCCTATWKSDITLHGERNLWEGTHDNVGKERTSTDRGWTHNLYIHYMGNERKRAEDRRIYLPGIGSPRRRRVDLVPCIPVIQETWGLDSAVWKSFVESANWKWFKQVTLSQKVIDTNNHPWWMPDTGWFDKKHFKNNLVPLKTLWNVEDRKSTLKYFYSKDFFYFTLQNIHCSYVFEVLFHI